MNRPALLGFGVLGIGALTMACGDGVPLPPGEAVLLVTVESHGDGERGGDGEPTVELGKAFPLTVARAWNSALTATDWDAASLAPLTLRLIESERRERDGRVEETLRYQAYAFSAGTVAVPSASFVARDDGTENGAERTATSEGFELEVRGSVDAEHPGPPELPGEPPPTPFPWLPVVGAVVGLLLSALALALLIARRSGQRPAVPAPPPRAEPSARELALSRLDALDAAGAASRDDNRALHAEVAQVLRSILAACYGAGTPQTTTEDLLEWALGSQPTTEQRARATDVLRACDLVKFARAEPDAKDRVRVLTLAKTFVRDAGGAGEEGRA